MAVFSINLIRKRTLPPRTRRRLFWGMIAYLALCGAVLVVIANRGTRRLQATERSRQQIAVMERQFCDQHPGQQDLLLYGKTVKQELSSLAETLEAVDLVCRERVYLARVLLALSQPLPKNVDLLKLSLNNNRQTLEFEIAFPIGESGDAVDAARLVASWNENADLTAQVGTISSVKSQRLRKESQLFDVWQFAGALKSKGTP